MIELAHDDLADAPSSSSSSSAPALPPELRQLEGLAAAADAQLAGADAPAGAPGGAGQAAAAVDEHTSVAGFLAMAAGVAAMACPPIGQAYTPEACATIATEYLRCAELYGWTWHKGAASPVVGLVAAAAMPVAMNLPAFLEWNKQRKAKAEAPTPPAAPGGQVHQLAAVETGEARSHAGVRL